MFLLLTATLPEARAQDMPAPEAAGEQHKTALEKKDWRIFGGVGTVISPKYPGSKSYNFTPIPFGEIRYKGRFFLNPYYGLGARFARFELGEGHELSLSTSFRYAFGSREEDERADFAGLGDVDGSVEWMVFGDYQLGDFNVGMEFSQGLNSSGHGGLRGTLSFEYGRRLFKFYDVQGGPFITWADNKYTRAYFGVTEEQAAASSFDQYEAGAGFHKAGFKVNVITFFTPRIGVYVLGLYSHLLNDAAHSPLIETRDEATVLAGIAYKF
ncbi:MipA/OmpV family protein [Emcibacter nanhaiensis]|nr:MipA/OmpV family protein [Emcibacter nanhaiensis]